MEIKIKYFSKDYPRLKKLPVGDWIDLRIDNYKGHITIDKDIFYSGTDRHFPKITYSEGDILKFGLGVAMELPDGYEAVVAPRSSTFKHWGLIQTNGIGVIDNSYCGDRDEWQIEFIAMRSGEINRHDRVCQFKIQENQPSFNFEEVDNLSNDSRGGFGTTGRD